MKKNDNSCPDQKLSIYSNILNYLGLLYEKLKSDQFEGEGFFVCICGVILWGFISFYTFNYSFIMIWQKIGVDETPKKVQGPFLLDYLVIPGTSGGRFLYIEKDEKIMETVCWGEVSEKYCSNTTKTKEFSKDYTLEYVIRSKDIHRSGRAVISRIISRKNGYKEVIFTNKSLKSFFLADYFYSVFFFLFFIYSLRCTYTAARRILFLINN